LIPDAFYTTDGILETTLTVLNLMGAYPAVISAEMDRYLPFLATSEILGLAVQKGIGREHAYNLIKKHAIAEALNMRENGIDTNTLLDRLIKESDFRKAGINIQTLEKILKDKSRYIGNAQVQIELIKTKSNSILSKYSNESKYKPGDIL
jgi:adenylosuccinate lyase